MCLGIRIIWPMRTVVGKITHTDGYLPTPLISGHRPGNVTEALTSSYIATTKNSEFITQNPPAYLDYILDPPHNHQ